MKYQEKFDKLLEHTQNSARLLSQLIQGANDYDLERLLKKIDAQLKDARHNLVLAQRMAREKKGK